MTEMEVATIGLSLLSAAVAIVAVTVFLFRVERAAVRQSYVPLDQRGGTPLSKGAKPYTNQVAPTVPPQGSSGASASHRHEYRIVDKYPSAECECGDSVRIKFIETVHVHSYRYSPGRPIAKCACGSAQWTGTP